MITEVYVDGSFKPAGSAAAVVIYQNKKEVYKTVKPLASQSSMASEAEAVLLGVNLCWVSNMVQPTIYTDSESIFNPFYNYSKIKNKNLAHYIYALKEMQKRFPFTLKKVKRNDVFVPDDMCRTFIQDAQNFYYQKMKEYNVD